MHEEVNGRAHRPLVCAGLVALACCAPATKEAKSERWRWDACEATLRADRCGDATAEQCADRIADLESGFRSSKSPYLFLLRHGCNSGEPNPRPRVKPACDPLPDPCGGSSGGDVSDGCGKTVHCSRERPPAWPRPTSGAAECELRACGPRPGMPSQQCADGSVGGNTGRCLRHGDGSCGWEIRPCPEP